MNDVRFALRQLRKSPGFTFLAVLTLALGIGANTAVFSLIHDLFLRGLPFHEPERIVHVYGEAKERDLRQLPFSIPKFWHYRDGQNVFTAVAADWNNGYILTGTGEPVQVLGANVTANYFDLLGVHPILGRNFLQQEEMKDNVALEQSYREQHGEAADSTWTSVLVSANEDATGDLRPAFVTLLIAVGAVLLIACSNVANLLLVRFTGRRREIAMRMALGGDRRSVVRLFVLESTTVSVIAGVIGLLLAIWVIEIVPKIAGDNVPLEGGITLHLPVLLFTLGLSLVTGLAMGVYPAWQSSRGDLVEGLKESGRSVS